MRARAFTSLIAMALAAAAIAGSLLATGCGSAAGTIDPVAQAAETTSNAGGAQIALSARVTSSALPAAVTVSGEGFFNYHTSEGQLTMSIAGVPLPGVAAGGLRVQELFKNSTVYVASPLFGGKLPGGAHWVRLDLGRFTQALGIDPTQLTSGETNPAQILDYLRASGGTTKVGTDTVRGVATTHYRGSVDLEKVAGVLPGADRSQLRASLQKAISELGLKTLPVDVWIDGHGLVRRFTLSVSASSAGVPVGSQISVELFGFGATKTVTAPATGETYDATQGALGALAGAG